MLCKAGSIQGINSEALALDTEPWLNKAASTITSLWTDGEMHTAMSDWGLELYVNGKKIAFFMAIRPSACIVEASLEWRTRICELSEQLAATLGVRFLEVSKHFVELVTQYQQLGVGGKKLVSLNGANENILARHVRICLVDGTHEEVEQITFLEFDGASNQFLFGHRTIEVSKIASITMPGDAPEDTAEKAIGASP